MSDSWLVTQSSGPWKLNASSFIQQLLFNTVVSPNPQGISSKTPIGCWLDKVFGDKGLRLCSFPNSLPACPVITSLCYMYMYVSHTPCSLVLPPPHTGRTFTCQLECQCPWVLFLAFGVCVAFSKVSKTLGLSFLVLQNQDINSNKALLWRLIIASITFIYWKSIGIKQWENTLQEYLVFFF